MIGRGRASLHADCLALELGVVNRLHVLKPAAFLSDQRVGRAVIVIGVERKFVGLDGAHDNVAAACRKRHADEAETLGIPGVFNGAAEFVGENFRDLVLEALALLVRVREVLRRRANAKHVSVHRVGQVTLGGLGATCRGDDETAEEES